MASRPSKIGNKVSTSYTDYHYSLATLAIWRRGREKKVPLWLLIFYDCIVYNFYLSTILRRLGKQKSKEVNKETLLDELVDPLDDLLDIQIKNITLETERKLGRYLPIIGYTYDENIIEREEIEEVIKPRRDKSIYTVVPRILLYTRLCEAYEKNRKNYKLQFKQSSSYRRCMLKVENRAVTFWARFLPFVDVDNDPHEVCDIEDFTPSFETWKSRIEIIENSYETA